MNQRKKQILVCGGAGYIGSHMVKVLLEAGFEPVVLDNLSTGHVDAVTGAKLIRGDIGDRAILKSIFDSHQIQAVFHFAAASIVKDSVQNPAFYYQNNVTKTLSLLDQMVESGIQHIIFSSTAAVYGNPDDILLREDTLINPINPYGKSKWMVEQSLVDYERAYGLKYMVFRYFNAAGNDLAGILGERHDPETHLIPIVLETAAKKGKQVTIFGDDYQTRDGTCIRDYVHVLDICNAHLLGFHALLSGMASSVFNIGSEQGYSVKEVIQLASVITGCKINASVGPRRAGDPAVLIADSRQIKKLLAWKPVYPELSDMIQHAWNYIKNSIKEKSSV